MTGINDRMSGALRLAAKAKDWPEVFRLIDREGGDPNAQLGYAGRTLLQRAAYLGDIPLMQALMDRGAELSETKTVFNVLQSAATSGQSHILHWVCEEAPGDITDYRDNKGRSLAHVGANTLSLSLLEIALKKGVNPNAVDDNGHTPLMLTMMSNNAAAVRCANELIDAGADIDFANEEKSGPITEALKYRFRHDQVRLLYDAGVNLDHPGIKTVLQKQKDHDREPSSQLLERLQAIPGLAEQGYAKPDLFAANGHGDTPLDNPQTWRRIGEVAHTLSEQGETLRCEDFKQENANGKTYFQRALECRALGDLLSVLARQGERLSPQDFTAEDGKTLNGFGQALVDRGVVQQELFTAAAWKGKSRHELKTFYDELPEPMQKQVTNLHQLAANLSRQERSAARFQ